MVKYKSDYEYYRLIEDIMMDDKFGMIGEIKQHGMTRLEHSLRVSYYSYKISRRLGLHYKETARAGLLHDFFENSSDTSKKGKLHQFINHPKEAVKNAKDNFEINDIEEDIIKCHMFPSNVLIPKYMESWIVNFVDKTVATYEFGKSFGYKFSYLTNFYFILLLNFLK